MTDYSDPTKTSLRLSNSDRESAVAALARAHTDGRLTADEYLERSTAARAAVTRGDLAPLFTDLPDTANESVIDSVSDPSPDPDLAPPAGFTAAPGSAPAGGLGAGARDGSGYRDGAGDGSGFDRRDDDRPDYSRRRPLGGAAGVVAVSITPILALVLFLLCGFFLPDGFRWSWIFWLAVPIVGIVVYGPGGRRDYDRR
ncbi:DUF1707 SHOCT-like domain-containing protein [Herbiconiux solani]|uniref:DUF1707 SHOCT-like domain-containing protein n=1 Tax=Herbiconiux solani TaxID=661329 RepID=UPI000825FE63|nr:DUF1707 domain-containing protein [Herbiconiux solani]